jgi:dihydrofolate reductase
MRTVIVNNIVSLDGFYADDNGNPLVLNMDAAFDRANLESIERADVVLLGRDSFDGFSAYWPGIADAPPQDELADAAARQYDDVNRAISRRWNAVPKVVVTDRGPIPASNAWAASTAAIGRAEVESWLETVDGDVVLFASHVLWNDMLARGLVDELHLMVSPAAVATGIPLFTAPARLKLLDARTFEGSSNLQLRYAVAPT